MRRRESLRAIGDGVTGLVPSGHVVVVFHAEFGHCAPCGGRHALQGRRAAARRSRHLALEAPERLSGARG